MLVVGFSTFGLDVLLDGVDLRLVFDELLLNIVQSIVDLALKNLVLLGVMSHGVVCHLLGQTILVCF